MAVTTAVLTGNINDLVGDGMQAVGAWVEANSPSLVDTAGNRWLVGPKRLEVAADGSFSVTLVRTDSADVQPTQNRQYRVFADVRDQRPGKANRGRLTVDSGWFNITADLQLSAAIEVDYVPATYVTTATQQLDAHAESLQAPMDAAVTDAQTYAADAEAARDLARDISNIDVSDDAIDVALQLPDGKAAARLSASTDARVPVINARSFGAKGDWNGATGTDDTAALQAAVNAAANGFLRNLDLEGRSYKTTATISMPAGTRMRNGAITLVTDNMPVLASKAYLDPATTPGGNLTLENLSLLGTGVGANQHGLVVLGYFAKIRNISTNSTGGDGVRVTSIRANGSDTSGLVENRFHNIRVQGYGKVGFHVTGNNNVTDGLLSSLLCYSSNPAAIHNVHFETSAGWQIDNVHTYGSVTSNSIVLEQTWFTHLNEVQVEPGWVGSGIKATIQRATHFDNIAIAIPAAVGATAMEMSKFGTYPGDGFGIGQLTVTNDNDVAVNAVSWDSMSTAGLGRLNIQGTFTSKVTPVSGFGATAVRRMNDALVKSQLRDSPGNKSLSVAGNVLASGVRKAWSGGAAQSITFTVPMTPSTSWCGMLQIGSATFNNGALLARYAGMVFVSVKTAADTTMTNLLDLATPTGFTTAPAISATYDGTTANITVTFTPSSTSGFGCSCSLMGAVD